MTDPDTARLVGAELAVQYHAAQDGLLRLGHHGADAAAGILATAAAISDWLLARPAAIHVGDPVILVRRNPALRVTARRAGADMAVTVKDTDISITYPAPTATDAKGAQVGDNITLTTDDTAGTTLAQETNDDGSTTFVIGLPGTVQLTWSDGTLSISDTVNVLPSDATAIEVGEPVIVNGPAS